MKSCLLLVLTGVATIFAANPQEPRVIELNGQPVLDVPQEMRAELAVKVPQFHMLADSDFLPSIIAELPQLRQQGVQLLWAVIGDFDGNGLNDVALIGHVADQAKFVLVFTKPTGYEFHIYDTGAFNPHEWYGVGNNKVEYGQWAYLRKIPRGTITSPYEEQPLELAGDAFETVMWGKAAVLQYWKDGELKRYITSD